MSPKQNHTQEQNEELIDRTFYQNVNELHAQRNYRYGVNISQDQPQNNQHPLEHHHVHYGADKRRAR